MSDRAAAIASLAVEPAWAMDRKAFDAMLAALASGWSPEQLRAAFGRASRLSERTGSSTAVVRIHGPIAHRPSFWSMLFGATSTLEIADELLMARADRSIDAIVLDVDSPGGSVSGITELAAAIRATRRRKPVIAIANVQAASAAYWLAAQASELLVSPSGEIGSLGVYTVHDDISKALEKLGVRTTLVSAGKYKTEGNPYEPLGDVAKAEMQRGVDHFYRQFVEDVALGRGTTPGKVERDFGQGRMVLPADAVAAGMADGIATQGEVRSRLSATAAEMEVLQARAALHRRRQTRAMAHR